MRFILPVLFVVSLSLWFVAQTPAQEKVPAKDKEKRIAEIQKELVG